MKYVSSYPAHGYFHSHQVSWTIPSGMISSSNTRPALLSLLRERDAVRARACSPHVQTRTLSRDADTGSL